MPEQGLIRIGQLAELSGVSVRSLRYYEELGLIKPAAHSQGGFRLYSEDELKKVDVINYLKELGLTLSEIQEIFNARKVNKSDREILNLIIKMLYEKLKLTEAKIEVLERIKRELSSTIEILGFCEFRDFGNPILHEQKELCERCDNLRSRSEIPKMLSIFF